MKRVYREIARIPWDKFLSDLMHYSIRRWYGHDDLWVNNTTHYWLTVRSKLHRITLK